VDRPYRRSRGGAHVPRKRDQQAAARTLGLQAEVQQALAAVVPRVFSDAGETVGFAETGETFERARLALAAAIESRMGGERK
jgi:hypothetical protein